MKAPHNTLHKTWLTVGDIEMEIVENKLIWTIISEQGDISFKADTFKQIIRRRPGFQLDQSIPCDERGGFSFDLTPGDKLNGELRPDIVERRKKQFEDYELAKRRFTLKEELERLYERRVLDRRKPKSS